MSVKIIHDLLLKIAFNLTAEQVKIPGLGLDPQEEVFAEDYDDPIKETLPQVTPMETAEDPELPEIKRGPSVLEVPACKNRSNPYHVCVNYCRDTWGMLTFDPDPSMVKRRDRMLNLYPLPESWLEVGDPQT